MHYWHYTTISFPEGDDWGEHTEHHRYCQCGDVENLVLKHKDPDAIGWNTIYYSDGGDSCQALETRFPNAKKAE